MGWYILVGFISFMAGASLVAYKRDNTPKINQSCMIRSNRSYMSNDSVHLSLVCEYCDTAWDTRFRDSPSKGDIITCHTCGEEHNLASVYWYTRKKLDRTRDHAGDGMETD